MSGHPSDLLDPAGRASDYLHRYYDHDFHPSHLKKDGALQKLLSSLKPCLETVFTVHEPDTPYPAASPGKPLRAITWNIERGKNLAGILKSLREDADLRDADFILLTEVDWGMARSGNLNITQEISRELGYYGYFAPSFFNLTRGHGGENKVSGANQWGLHGKAIVSRSPLQNPRTVALPNLTNLMRKGEARYGCKRALLADFSPAGLDPLTLACVHLDCYSSPRSRAFQIKPLLYALSQAPRALIAGDWNTNTHNTTHTPGLTLSVLKQLLAGPKKAVTQKYAHTHAHFDKPLFDLLSLHSFDVAGFNELGVSTFDLFINAEELGAMAAERLPKPLIKAIDRLIGYCGGHIPLKLDWFAAKNLQGRKARVVKLAADYNLGGRPPSDHHPVMVEFSAPEIPLAPGR